MAFPKKAEEEKYLKQTLSFPPSLHQRLIKYCQSDQRSMSWVVQQALDKWLKDRGF